MELQEYLIRGNHPILRYINWNAKGIQELDKKVRELEGMGYEVTVYKVGQTNRDGEQGPPSQPNYKGNIPS